MLNGDSGRSSERPQPKARVQKRLKSDKRSEAICSWYDGVADRRRGPLRGLWLGGRVSGRNDIPSEGAGADRMFASNVHFAANAGREGLDGSARVRAVSMLMQAVRARLIAWRASSRIRKASEVGLAFASDSRSEPRRRTA